jgi:hypothetical protein
VYTGPLYSTPYPLYIYTLKNKNQTLLIHIYIHSNYIITCLCHIILYNDTVSKILLVMRVMPWKTNHVISLDLRKKSARCYFNLSADMKISGWFNMLWSIPRRFVISTNHTKISQVWWKHNKLKHLLVGGWPTPLKNDGVGSVGMIIPFPTFHGKWFKIPWFQTTNQLEAHMDHRGMKPHNLLVDCNLSW